MTHITLLTIGSRGDVQPYIALGVGLRQAGYQVRLATHANFETMIRDRGLEFALITGNPQERLQSPEGQALLSIRNPFRIISQVLTTFREIFISSIEDTWQACQGTDAIVAGSATFFWGVDMAQKLDIPLFCAFLQPGSPTRAFPSIVFPPVFRRLGGPFNRLSYSLVYELVWLFFRKPVNQFRKTVLALPTIRQSPLPRIYRQGGQVLNAVSPSVYPRPKDWSNKDHMTGYWFLDHDETFEPPTDLVDFLAAGPAPVYVGFGSMTGKESGQIVDLALSALKKTGRRGVFLGGWSTLEAVDLPDNVFRISSIPHDWLFPQMACIVHHGGAGTTAATLRAGIPGVIIPFLVDQPTWGDRVYRLGVSPAPITRKRQTVDAIAQAIEETIQDQEMRDRAALLGSKIQAEHGVTKTVDIIAQTLNTNSNDDRLII